MIYLLFSFAIGIGGGVFEVRGDDIVSPSFGPTAEVFFNIEIIPDLVYDISIKGGRADASTRSLAYIEVEQGDTTAFIAVSRVLGEEFEFVEGNLSLDWYPFPMQIKPYISARLGLMRWRFKSNGEVTRSLNGNEFDRYSLSLGGGIGVSTGFSGFVLSVDVVSDFIFSVDNDWKDGFGTGDDNEYAVGVNIRIARGF